MKKEIALLCLLALAVPVSGRAFDHTHAAFDAVLKKYVMGEKVKYAALKVSDQGLNAYIETLGKVSPAKFSHFNKSQKMTYWINAYNAFTLKSLIEKYPVESIRKISGVWEKRKWNAGGRQVTLDEIEHKILRPMGDPRIHAAVNCASISCPKLADFAFSAEKLNAQLKSAAQSWARSKSRNRFKASVKTAYISRIFSWYGEDFIPRYYKEGQFPKLSKKEAAAVNFLYIHGTKADQMVIDAGINRVKWQDYDWRINE